MFDLEKAGKNAKIASLSLKQLDENSINKILLKVADDIIQNKEYLQKQNAIDIEYAKQKGISEAFIDRLTLSDKVIFSMAEGVKDLTLLTSPVGREVYSYKNEYQDIDIKKINVPFGVIGIIYESRPNVTVDAFSLCFKTKNAVILKGGSDAINSNIAVAKVIKQTLIENGVDENAITVIEDTSRETTTKFMQLNGYVDLLIPRGSASLINNALKNATIPIIQTGTGNCHAFIDESANIDMASKIVFNAKTQRYGVCNALESLVVHSKILEKALPAIAEKLKEKKVVIRADERSKKALIGYPYLEDATDEDFYTEYCDGILSVKTVDSLDEAIEHINAHSTGHSETIITENTNNANKFLEFIDSSSVYHNASTRFTDGFVFGLGAEIGISTQKLHARGPMGLEALVTTKYVVKGNGSIRK